MVLLLGVDRFMSEARAITNTIGNGVATLAIARWVGALDMHRLKVALDGKPLPTPEAEVEERVTVAEPGLPTLTGKTL